MTNAKTRRLTALMVIRKVVPDQTEKVAVSKGTAIIARNTGTKQLIVLPRRERMRKSKQIMLSVAKTTKKSFFLHLKKKISKCRRISKITKISKTTMIWKKPM